MRTIYIPDDAYRAILGRLNARDRYICELLRETGFRLDDILHCRVWQLNKPEIRLRERKTGKLRTVALPERLYYSTYCHFKTYARGEVLRYAFPSLRKEHCKVHRTTIWRHFNEAVVRCGYGGKGYSLHSLRKCYAVDLFSRCGLDAVQSDLGHSSQSTTLLYALSNMIS